MEGAVANHGIDKRDEYIMALATYQFTSEIFTTYFQLPSECGEKIASAAPVNFQRANKKILWVASSCRSWNGREQLVRALQKLHLLDSVGSCLRNKIVKKVVGYQNGINKDALMGQYF
eukprot:GEMP01108432.1.p2 GENE.GEMP01108432.1~~GEMP01108432.1.p2  ORF type:complete len:118 (+),score=26.09 GEMP01108432.1:333-686(+)